MTGYARWGKRIFDLVLTVIALPLILPFWILTAIVIKIDSPGPVLVKLNRLGKDGILFEKYKFRTMVVGAEAVLVGLLERDPDIREEYERTFKIQNDPRITRFGNLLRKTSLDELPQVINVVRGEMSWVGPRDILDSELVMYGEYGDRLLTVKPGITGLWQVSGRSNLPYSERVRLDMEYIDRVSLVLDTWILWRTVPVVLLGHGAA